MGRKSYDPRKTFSENTRGEYNDYVRDFRAFELEQIEKSNQQTLP